jgi:hypothetical protein
MVVTDGAIHEERFGKAKGIEVRRSVAAAKILGCRIHFMGIPDTEDIPFLSFRPAIVITPAKQGGNRHHDQLSQYGSIHYATYTKSRLTPFLADGYAIEPTAEEVEIKRRVLACYGSQHDINRPHFAAVDNGEPEYIKGVLATSVRRALRLDR